MDVMSVDARALLAAAAGERPSAAALVGML
jgi:hypothetical protein